MGHRWPYFESQTHCCVKLVELSDSLGQLGNDDLPRTLIHQDAAEHLVLLMYVVCKDSPVGRELWETLSHLEQSDPWDQITQYSVKFGLTGVDWSIRCIEQPMSAGH
jgi:hypothetical protein